MKTRVGIRGAGVAGLSLARELMSTSADVEVSIFDQRQATPYPQRTFCYFSDSDSQMPINPCHTWSKIRLCGDNFERIIQSDNYPYVMIQGEIFFAQTQAELLTRGVKFFWGQGDVRIKDQTIIVDGESFYFDYVIDAAFKSSETRAVLWQSFAGYWVTTERENFDSTTATLMDLDQSTTTSPVSFMYILPISSREALVEHTTFSKQPLPANSHLQKCEKWIGKNIQGTVVKNSEERGSIPMGLKQEPSASGIKIGSNAGAIRAGTGYAFKTIQKQARDLSSIILNHSVLNHSVLRGEKVQVKLKAYPYLLVQADLLFLKSLSNTPEDGALILGQLLKSAPAKPLIKFLSGSPSFIEALRVMLTVPKITMIRSLLRR